MILIKDCWVSLNSRSAELFISSSSSSDAKRSAEASRRCDRSPERSVLRYLQGLSRCITRVTTDLVDPGGGWSTTGTSPLLRGPVTVPRLGTDSKDLVWRRDQTDPVFVCGRCMLLINHRKTSSKARNWPKNRHFTKLRVINKKQQRHKRFAAVK